MIDKIRMSVGVGHVVGVSGYGQKLSGSGHKIQGSRLHINTHAFFMLPHLHPQSFMPFPPVFDSTCDPGPQSQS